MFSELELDNTEYFISSSIFVKCFKAGRLSISFKNFFISSDTAVAKSSSLYEDLFFA